MRRAGRRLAQTCTCVFIAALAAATPAAAGTDTQSPYRATAPTRGSLTSDGPSGRYLLGGTWLTRPDVGDVGLSERWQDSSSTVGWSPVRIPDAYNAGQLTSEGMSGWVQWYRRDFTLPRDAFPSYVPAAARAWMIDFESVNYRASVWLNGRLLGRHAVANMPFEFRLSALRRGVNRLVVRVDNRRTVADFPPGPSGGWWNFGGILDAVYLRPIARVDLSSVLIRPELSCARCAAVVHERATVRNFTSARQTVELTGSYGRYRLSFGRHTLAPGAIWAPSASVRIRRPRLWSLFAPRLYEATVRVSDRRGRRLGGYSFRSGIRKIEITRRGVLELNGQPLHLRGFNLHEQTATTGSALDLSQMGRLIGWAKELGAGIIRAHYPLSPEMQQMADEDGILLWSEIPVYQTPVKEIRQRRWVRAALGLLSESIEENENHPSILLWSIGNELPAPAGTAVARYMRLAAARAHSLDPSRPVGMALLNWPNMPCQAAYAPLGVLGINDYFGWFISGGGSNDDRDEIGPYLDELRACYPHQAIIWSEWGYGADRKGPVEVRGTYANQVNQIEFDLRVFATKPWLAGAIYFPMQDFAARPGFDGGDPLGRPPIVDKGVLDRFGDRKPSFSVIASIYHHTRQLGGPG